MTKDDKDVATMITDPVDELLPQWIEFTRLGNEKEIQEAVIAFFEDPDATANDFKQQFDIDLNSYKNFYLETGAVDAPTGPCLGGRISPILVMKQSRSGKSFSPHILKHEGVVKENFRYAWIKRLAWDNFVDDTFAEELKKQAAHVRDSQESIKKKLIEKANDEE